MLSCEGTGGRSSRATARVWLGRSAGRFSMKIGHGQASTRIPTTRDDGNRARESGPSRGNLTKCKSRSDREAHRRQHPEARGNANALDAGQHHQPRIWRLVDDRPVQEASVPARDSTATSPARRARRTSSPIVAATPSAPTGASRRRSPGTAVRPKAAYAACPPKQAAGRQMSSFPRPEVQTATPQSRKRQTATATNTRAIFRRPTSLLHRIAPANRQSRDDEHDDRQAGKNVGFRVFHRVQPSPGDEIAGALSTLPTSALKEMISSRPRRRPYACWKRQ